VGAIDVRACACLCVPVRRCACLCAFVRHVCAPSTLRDIVVWCKPSSSLSLADERKDLWIITKEEINVGLQLLGYSDAMVEQYSSIEVGSKAFGCLSASLLGFA
jgi:hypothetical protein